MKESERKAKVRKWFRDSDKLERLYCKTCSRWVTKEDIELTVNGTIVHKGHELAWEV
jgi:hypothetical protein